MSENLDPPSPDAGRPLRFSTPSGLILFEPEAFMADVVNAVNDLILSGFDNMEEFAAKRLDFQGGRDRRDLRNGINKIYHGVQDVVDDHLSRWESTCRANFSNISSDSEPPRASEEATQKTAAKGTADIEGLQVQEQSLDEELRSLRSQLILAQRETARMRKEMSSLERKRALWNDLSDVLKNFPCHEEVIMLANKLNKQLVDAKRTMKMDL